MESIVTQIHACTECGARNETVGWRSPRHRGGVLVGVFCAACAQRINDAPPMTETTATNARPDAPESESEM